MEIDWCRCPLLESVPGKVSGAWVIKGTRMRAHAISGERVVDGCGLLDSGGTRPSTT